MSEVIVAAGGLLVAALVLVHEVGTKSRAEDREQIKEIGDAVSEFYDNFLGWFNRIMNFSSSVLADGRAGSLLNEARINEYKKLLQEIINDDRYFSKCRSFLDIDWNKRLNTILSINPQEVSEKIDLLRTRFESLFVVELLELKSELGRLLTKWGEANEQERKCLLDNLETGMQQFDNCKEQVSKSLDKVQNL